MEVIYTGIRRTPEQVVRMAIDEDVDVVGVSILSGAHTVLLPRIRELLNEAGAENTVIIAGGVIPHGDIDELYRNGVAKVFRSGTYLSEIVSFLESSVNRDTTGLSDQP